MYRLCYTPPLLPSSTTQRMKPSRVPSALLHPRNWPQWAVMGLLWLWGRLPYRWATALGRAFGCVLYPFARLRRHVARRNLDLCFPEWDDATRRALVKKNFAYTGKAFAEIALAWFAPRRRLEPLLEMRGKEHVDQALAQGNGVILLSAHFTCLELTPPLV